MLEQVVVLYFGFNKCHCGWVILVLIVECEVYPIAEAVLRGRFSGNSFATRYYKEVGVQHHVPLALPRKDPCTSCTVG
jgi:hypothetical protein